MTPGRRQRLMLGARLLFPWISLVVGIIGAAMMRRTPERAPYVAAAGIAVWLTLTLRIALDPGDQPPKNRLQRLAHFTALFATQGLTQLPLFFGLPFFIDAAVWGDPGHGAFLVGAVLLAGISLWDPWTEKLFARAATGHLLPTAATFIGLTAVLPGLGISNRQSLWCAAGAAAVGAMVAGFAWHRRRPSRYDLLATVMTALGMPAFLLLGGARLVPAAPMELVEASFGTQKRGHWIADPTSHLASRPGRLICATAIYAPHGVHETLWHVWREDGEFHHRIDVDVTGGRKAGYRTRSFMRRPQLAEQARYDCTVETDMGQVLGSTEVTIGRPPDR